MPELQIIGAPQSNYVWVARIACTEKGVPYTLVPVLPHSPEVDAIHPFGKIPAMRHGDVTLCESRAISFYIDHAFAGPPLAPRDPVAGARTEQWISLVNTHIDPLLVRQYLGAYFFPGTPDGGPDRARIEKILPQMEPHFAVLDRAVAKTGHLVGDSFTLCRHQPAADLVLSRQTAGKPGDAAARDAPRRLLQTPPRAGERRRNHPAAFPRPLLVGNRGLSRRRDHALHVRRVLYRRLREPRRGDRWGQENPTACKGGEGCVEIRPIVEVPPL
jgi:glutathione S-transferase